MVDQLENVSVSVLLDRVLNAHGRPSLVGEGMLTDQIISNRLMSDEDIINARLMKSSLIIDELSKSTEDGPSSFSGQTSDSPILDESNISSSFNDRFVYDHEPTVQELVEDRDTSESPTALLKLKVLEKLREQTKHFVEAHHEQTSKSELVEMMKSKFTSSFFTVDVGTVIDKFLLWKRHLPRVQPFYAVKSNPDEVICKTLHILSAGYDCASKAEIKQVLEIGAVPNNIIYANPCKPVSDILFAKEHGVEMMTFDNEYELEKIHEIYPSAKLVLRVLPDDSHSLMPFGIKFGASFKDSVRLLERSQELGMSVIGVSFHVGSGCFSSIAWIEALKLSRDIFDEGARFGHKMNLLDIGGGWPGIEKALKVSQVGDEISPVIDALFPPHVRVISEPGRFFCAESSTLATKVVSKRKVVSQCETEEEHQLYITDGIYGSFNCIIFDHYKPQPVLLSDDAFMRPLQKTTIFGPTCDSMDVIMKGELFQESNVGEWLFFENMGAYTIAAASTFNGMPLPSIEYVMSIR